MSRFLITGGAGFIGSNFCHYMVNKYPSDEFFCLDALTYAANIDNISVLFECDNFKFIKENICNKERIDEIFKEYKFDYVVNFAAETHVDRSIDNPDIFIQTNVLGLNNLLDASYKYGVKRFHQISTDEVYGDLNFDSPLFKEDNILKPSSPYSASKASGDLLVLAYHRTFNLDVTISRCSNNYGKYQHDEKLIPFVIKSAINRNKIGIYGNGLNVRDWIYVTDHCKAIDLILTTGKNGGIYNVGGNNEINNIDLVKLILKKMKVSEELIEFVEDRKGHDLRYGLDTTKLKEELGFECEVSFLNGIDETIDWYMKGL